MAEAQLPEAIEACLARFEDDNWRERKVASAELLDLITVEQLDGVTLESLVTRLIDTIVDPPALAARAAASEALIGLGRLSLAELQRRVSDHGAGAHLLLDVIRGLGTPVDANWLVSIATDEALDPNLRSSAVAALGSAGGKVAIEALEELLVDPSEVIRVYAIDGLREAGAVVPAAKLEPVLRTPMTRKATVALLGRTGDDDAVTLLVPLLSDPMKGVRAAAARALAELWTRTADSERARRLRDVISNFSETTRARVRELIGHSDRSVSAAALRLAALARDADAVAAAVPHLDDPELFECSAELITELGHAANGALVAAIEEHGAGVREPMLRLIGALRSDVVDPRLSAVLLEALEDMQDSVVCAACRALELVGGRAAMAPLYRRCSTEGVVGEFAARALAEIAVRSGGGRSDLDLIIGGTWPQQGALAINVCRVVGRLGLIDYVPPLVSLLGSMEVGVRVAAAHALGMIEGDHEGVGALCFALADEEPAVRAGACRSLGQLRAPQSVQPLLSATADPAPLVRAAAVSALVKMDNPMTISRMREIIMDDASTTVVVQAIAGIGHSKNDQDLIMLMSLCSSEDHEVVKAAARALQNFAAHRATAALLGLLDHERWDVRWAAAEVLAKRGDPTALGSLERAHELERDGTVRGVIAEAIRGLSRAVTTEGT